MVFLFHLPIFGVILIIERDPLTLFSRYVWKLQLWSILQFLIFPVSTDAACGLAFGICVLVITTYYGLTCGHHLYTIAVREDKWQKGIKKVLNYYDSLRIVMIGTDEMSSPFCFVMHGAGLVTSVGFSFAVIRLRDRMPILLWAMLVFILCATLLIISIMMPMISEIYELSNRGLKKWEEKLKGLHGIALKCGVRQMKSRTPCKLYAGLLGYHFYFSEAGTKVKYYEIVFTHIINAILAK